MKEYTSAISFEFPTVESRTVFGEKNDYQPKLAVEIYKSEAVPEDGHTYALPAPSERKPTTITITEDAAGSKKLSLGMADGETFFFRFKNPNGKYLPIAVKILIDGVNVLTDTTETDVTALADGDPSHIDGQNFMVVPPQEWLDGYRIHRKPNPDKPSVDKATGRSREHAVYQFKAVNDPTKKDSTIQIVAIPYGRVAEVTRGISFMTGGEIESKIYASEYKSNKFNPKHAQSISLTPTLDPACRAVPMSEASTVFLIKDQHMPAAPTSANGLAGMTGALSSASLADAKQPALQPARTVALQPASQMTIEERRAQHKKVEEYFNHPRVLGPQIVFALEQVVTNDRLDCGLTNFHKILGHPAGTVDAIFNKTSDIEKIRLVRQFFDWQLPPIEHAHFLMQVLFRCKNQAAKELFESWPWSKQKECLNLFPLNIDNLPSHSQTLVGQLKLVHAAAAPKRRREQDDSSDADKEGKRSARISGCKSSSPTLSPRAAFLPPPAAVASQSDSQLKLQGLVNAEYKLNVSVSVNTIDDQEIFTLLIPENNAGPDAERFTDFVTSLGCLPIIGENTIIFMNADQCKKAIAKLGEIQSGLSPRM